MCPTTTTRQKVRQPLEPRSKVLLAQSAMPLKAQPTRQMRPRPATDQKSRRKELKGVPSRVPLFAFCNAACGPHVHSI